MAWETLEYLVTPCSSRARVMGYLSELIGIRSRYRRCQPDWQPHLDRTKQSIRSAAEQCPSRRKAVLFGSGYLLDIPLKELAQSFQTVILADVLFPWPTRWECRNWPNVKCQVVDVTASMDSVYRLGPVGGNLPRPKPTVFLDDPEVDFVASVNLLSQLPYIPCRYLSRWNRFSENSLLEFARHLIQAHLDYLRSFPCPVFLATDLEYLTLNSQEQLLEKRDALRGVTLPPPQAEWIWRLAPGKEEIPHHFHRVGAFTLGI